MTTTHETLAQKNHSKPNLERRELLMGAGALATMTVAGSAMAAMPGHDHSKHSPQNVDLLNAVNTCLDKGQRCTAHCLVSFVEGDTALAKCAAKVHEMHAVCEAFSYLVTSNSSYTKAYAEICEQVCKDCEKECLEHKKHVECRECANACADVVDQIKLRLG